jgi:hypothetical protein
MKMWQVTKVASKPMAEDVIAIIASTSLHVVYSTGIT